MNYRDYTLDTLQKLGLHRIFRGCEYIACGIEYLYSMDKWKTPESNIIYYFIADNFFLEPEAVENSIRNVLLRIWSSKENPILMQTIFGSYNLDQKPCNLEFLILLYNYVRQNLEETETLRKLDTVWHHSKLTYLEKQKRS